MSAPGTAAPARRGRRPSGTARRDSPSASGSWPDGTPSIAPLRRRRGHSSSSSSIDPAPLDRRARPAAIDGPARRPEAGQRRAPRRRTRGIHRLADDGPGAGRSRARLDAGRQQLEPARSSPRRCLAALPGGGRPGRRRRMHLGASWSMGGDRNRPIQERIDGRFGTLPPRGLDATIGDWDAQVDLTWIVGLLLRGWRKGLDAEAGETLGSGVSASDDLRAVDRASRPWGPPAGASARGGEVAAREDHQGGDDRGGGHDPRAGRSRRDRRSRRGPSSGRRSGTARTAAGPSRPATASRGSRGSTRRARTASVRLIAGLRRSNETDASSPIDPSAQ